MVIVDVWVDPKTLRGSWRPVCSVLPYV